MGKRTVYFDERSNEETTLEAYCNTNGDLYVCMSPFESHSGDIPIIIPHKDAITLISKLAYEFGLVNDDSMDSGHYFWEGENH
jgi:hypothetical protein